MEGIEYTYELFESLPRCGPGDNKSTQRAFNAIPKPPEHPLILDIGCGPGVQTIELAKLSQGRIIALDNHQAFLDKLMKKAKEEELLDHIVPKNKSMLDMDFEDNTFDIISFNILKKNIQILRLLKTRLNQSKMKDSI